MSQATAQIETVRLPPRTATPDANGYRAPVKTDDASALADQAAATLSAVVPPSGAGPYRDQFVALYRQRAEIAREPRATGGGFECAAQPNAPSCAQFRAAQDQLSAKLVAWNEDLASLRRRYEAWLISQGR